jgi:hypothetical protein
MTFPGTSLERQAEALARAQRHWQEPTVTRAWTIALTREAGTPGVELAREIGRRHHWPVYDRELIERIASEMGHHANLLDSLDEKHRSWLLEAVQSLTLAGPVSEAKFIRRLVETVLSLGAIGHCVIVGRGAAQILPPESTLRVRLVAAKEDRVAAAQRKRDLTRVQAERWVEETDRERARFVAEHFHKDPSDPSRYDLVLNMSRWSVEEAADLVLDALKKMEALIPV